MASPQTTTSPAQPIESDLRLISALVYGLYLFALFNGFTALIGVVIAYVKRGDARGTVYESHFSNAITVFWATTAVLIFFVAMVLAGIVGVFAFFGPEIWTSHGNWNGDNWPGHHWHWQGDPPFNPPHGWWPLLILLPVAHLALLGFAVWWFYRVVRGLLHALEGNPY